MASCNRAVIASSVIPGIERARSSPETPSRIPLFETGIIMTPEAILSRGEFHPGVPARGEKAALRDRLVHLPHQEKIAGLERRARRSAGARLPVATPQSRCPDTTR